MSDTALRPASAPGRRRFDVIEPVGCAVPLKLVGTTLHVTWTAYDLAGDNNAGPVHEFVVRFAPSGSEQVLETRRLPTNQRATDFADLPPGQYDVLVQELNDSGLSAGFCDTRATGAPRHADSGTDECALPTRNRDAHPRGDTDGVTSVRAGADCGVGAQARHQGEADEQPAVDRGR